MGAQHQLIPSHHQSHSSPIPTNPISTQTRDTCSGSGTQSGRRNPCRHWRAAFRCCWSFSAVRSATSIPASWSSSSSGLLRAGAGDGLRHRPGEGRAHARGRLQRPRRLERGLHAEPLRAHEPRARHRARPGAIEHVAYYNERLDRIEIYARFEREEVIELPSSGAASGSRAAR